MPKIIPEGVAREMAYVGSRLPASRAHQVGLVNEVFEWRPGWEYRLDGPDNP